MCSSAARSCSCSDRTEPAKLRSICPIRAAPIRRRSCAPSSTSQCRGCARGSMRLHALSLNLLLFNHLAALLADLVLVVLKAGQQHARVLTLALAEFRDVGAAGRALLR